MGVKGRRGIFMGEGEGVLISNGSQLDFHCDSTAGWTLTSDGNSVASLIGSTIFRMFSGETPNVSNLAAFSKDSAFIPVVSGHTILSYDQEVNHLEDISEGTGFTQIICGYNSAGNRRLNVNVYADSFHMVNNSGTRIDNSVVFPLGSEDIINFDIDTATNTCDVYVNSTKVLTGVECGQPTSGAAGRISLAHMNTRAVGFTPSTHDFDRILVGDDFAL